MRLPIETTVALVGTTTKAVRSASPVPPQPAKRSSLPPRLALWCVYQAHWTGRHAWHTNLG